MKKIEVIARSPQEALQKAQQKLGAILEDLTVVEEYEPDEVDLKTLADEEAAAGISNPTGEPTLYIIEQSADELLDRAEEWLQGLVQRFQPGATIEVVADDDDRLRGIIDAPDPSIFIGKQGQTLDALQHVASRIVQIHVEGLPTITLEVGNYREKREHQLRRLAENAAAKAQRSRRSVALPPMTSQDRKLIHNILKTIPGIATISEGREPNRYIVVEIEGASNRAPGGPGRRGGKPDGNRAPAPEPTTLDSNETDEASEAEATAPPAKTGGRQGKGTKRGASKAAAKSATKPAAKPKKMPLERSADSEEYREEHLEEGRSRLPAWQEPSDAPDAEGVRPLVDELE